MRNEEREIHQVIQREIGQPKRVWSQPWEEREFSGRKQKQQGQKIRGVYRQRWGIENQGFRYLSETWNIDRPAGHSYGAVLARLVFVFMICNCSNRPAVSGWIMPPS